MASQGITITLRAPSVVPPGLRSFHYTEGRHPLRS